MQDPQRLVHLARGGVIVNTKIGSIQFGVPPETIKDCMQMSIEIPGMFVFPRELFDRTSGINVAEAEFPAYFNFFVLKKVVQFICTKEQEQRMRIVFRETLLGPQHYKNLHKEFAPGFPEDEKPQLDKECAAIRTFHSIDEIFKFVQFDDRGIAMLKDGVSVRDAGDVFIVLEESVEIARVPSKVSIPEFIWQGSVLSFDPNVPMFEPPLFGITILGSGHGMDPSHRTSGFVVWINRRGVMVDPPLNSRAVLQKHGVPSRLIDVVVITHCHADHDEGALQKLLEENQITLVTSPTILGSFIRKYSALTGLSKDFLRRLFIFRPTIIGESMKIHGGEFRFFYSIHTIPCIGFEVFYGGKSIYFSADTCWDAHFIRKLEQDGAVRRGRADFWINFKFHHNIILHEAGVPPIHTPVSVLARLDEDVKKRLFLIHTSAKSVPDSSHLKIAPEGVSNTISIDVRPHVFADAIEILKIIDSVDLFSFFTMGQAREVLLNAIPRHYVVGETILRKGSVGAEFFIITAGVVSIEDKHWAKNLVIGDYFGEMSLVTGAAVSATAIAKTEVDLVAFKKEDFLAILRGNTKTVHFIQNLYQRRQESSWEVIEGNSVLYRMTNAQKTRFQALLRKIEWRRDEFLWREGIPAIFGILIAEGSLSLKDKPDLAPFTVGSFLGEVNSILSDSTVASTCVATQTGWGYSVEREDLKAFFHSNPGVYLCFLDTIFVDALSEAEKHKIRLNRSQGFSF